MTSALSDSADVPPRILVVTGQAGSGKTHLVLREFSKYSHPTYGVMIYKPNTYIDFQKWFNQKIIAQLLKRHADGDSSSALQHIAKAVLGKAFPDQKNKKESSLGRLIDDAVEVVVEAADANPLTRGVKKLHKPFSKGKRLTIIAEELVTKLDIHDVGHANAFCVALVILASARATDASRIFAGGRVPEFLEAAIPQSSVESWNLTELLCRTLKFIGGSLVVFFDQLESLVPRHGDQVTSLGALMASCLEVAETNHNCGFIISAPLEVANPAIATLQEAEQHRVLHPYGTQSVELVKKGDIASFFGPRFDYLRDCGAPLPLTTALIAFADWLDDIAMLPLPPRLLLMAMHQYSFEWVRTGGKIEEPNESVWRVAREHYDPKRMSVSGAAIAQPPKAESQIASVDEQWTAQEAEFQRSPLDVASADDAVGTIRSALSVICSAYPGVRAVKFVDPHGRGELASLRFTVSFNSGKEHTRELIVLDQRNYAGELLNALKQINGDKPTSGSVVAWLGNRFPATGKLQPELRELRKAGVEPADLLPSETMTLKQLEALRLQVPEPAFQTWFKAKALSLPTLGACLRSI